MKVKIWFDAKQRCWIAFRREEDGSTFYGFNTLAEAMNWAHQK